MYYAVHRTMYTKRPYSRQPPVSRWHLCLVGTAEDYEVRDCLRCLTDLLELGIKGLAGSREHLFTCNTYVHGSALQHHLMNTYVHETATAKPQLIQNRHRHTGWP